MSLLSRFRDYMAPDLPPEMMARSLDMNEAYDEFQKSMVNVTVEPRDDRMYVARGYPVMSYGTAMMYASGFSMAYTSAPAYYQAPQQVLSWPELNEEFRT